MSRIFPNLSRQLYEERRAEVAAAKRSPYYLWWICLSLSPEYWRLCQAKGKTGDPEFSRVYEHFGDVFEGEFEEWWLAHGKAAFAYKIRPPRVRYINPSDAREFSQSGHIRNARVVVIPDHYSKSELLRQFRALLSDYVPQALSARYASPFEVASQRGIKRGMLRDVLRVKIVSDALQIVKAKQLIARPERYGAAWIGRIADISPQSRGEKLRTKDTERNERLALRVKVARYQLKASRLIANAEIGIFPSLVNRATNPKRWTKAQIARFSKDEIKNPFISPMVPYEDYLKLMR